ncbi:MAG: sugar transferase [Lacibacter sp.]
MSSRSNLLTLSHENSQLLESSFAVESVLHTSPLSFFFIGSKHKAAQYFETHFKSGVFAAGFDKAISLIFRASLNKQLPDVIFIDTPFERQKMEAFAFVLKSDPFLSKIPVIYNDTHLDADMVYDLVSNDLIDEATDIYYWNRNFENKLFFLKKLKKHQKNSIHKTSANHSQSSGWQRINAFLKRLFDVVVSAFLLLLLLPVFAVIATAIRFESRGPVFYNSLRAGRGFKVFKFFKFRTMEVDADKKIDQLAHLNQYGKDSSGAKFLKICNDPRITKTGKLLRNTSLDELPQLLNVLLGDMSLVGNRPLPIYEAASLTGSEAVERFMAPAGITGLWQVEKRSNQRMSAEERINLDIEYARHHNFMYDMFILAKTPMALIQKTNV